MIGNKTFRAVWVEVLSKELRFTTTIKPKMYQKITKTAQILNKKQSKTVLRWPHQKIVNDVKKSLIGGEKTWNHYV